jgi:glycosyltransferase involved in cell wall biosynthesis
MRLSHLHFHHTLGLETSVWGLPRELGLPFDITLHDYYFINANPTQTDSRGHYQPEPERQASSYPLPVPLADWKSAQRRLLDTANRIIAPSTATAREIERHFPGLNITVALHPDSEQQMPWPGVKTKYRPGEPLRILVLGALSPEKGADLLEATARKAQQSGAPLEFHLLGYAYRPLDDAVTVHGAYTHEELPTRIREIAPHLIWFTALWPETYSYTLSEALLTGLPIVAPDLGAFPERLKGRPLTWVEPWNRTAPQWVPFFTTHIAALEEASDRELSWNDQPYPGNTPGFYRHQYLATQTRATDFPLEPQALDQLLHQALALGRDLRSSRREALLRHLLNLRRRPLGRLISRMIPVQIQRRIKRSLSRRPIHEIE